MSASICLTSSLYRIFSLLATSSDRFPIPVRWAVKSYLTAWCIQNLSNRATLNAATLVHSVTSERKLDSVQNFHFQYQKSFREPKTRWHGLFSPISGPLSCISPLRLRWLYQLFHASNRAYELATTIPMNHYQ